MSDFMIEHFIYFRSDTIFTIGIACYQLFIQANWTGPLLKL